MLRLRSRDSEISSIEQRERGANEIRFSRIFAFDRRAPASWLSNRRVFHILSGNVGRRFGACRDEAGDVEPHVGQRVDALRALGG